MRTIDGVENADRDRVMQAACLRLLRTSQGLTRFSGCAGLTSVVLLWVWAGGMASRFGLGAVLLAASACAGLAVAYYGFRLHLDAELFALVDEPGRVGDAAFATGIDAFRMQLRGSVAPSGVLGPRYAGALRLWRRWVAVLGLQTVLLAGATGAVCLTAFAAV